MITINIFKKTNRFDVTFKTNEGLLINADQNGSLNILRKYLNDKCILRTIKQARDNGFVANPSRLRVS